MRRLAALEPADVADDPLAVVVQVCDAVFRALPVVAFEGYSRPLVRVSNYLELVERSTYRGNRVRP